MQPLARGTGHTGHTLRWGRRSTGEGAKLGARGAPLSLVSDPELCFGSGAGFTGDAAAAAPAAPAAPTLAAPPAPAFAAARRRGLSLCLALARTSFTPHALHRVLGPARHSIWS